MGTPRIVSIIGKKSTGKTSVLVALSAELNRRGHRVSTLKHATHPARLDVEGTDSYQHMEQGKADATLLDAPGQLTYFEHTTEAGDPIKLAQRFLEHAEIVLVEGYSDAPLPKIEVYRPSIHAEPIYRPDREDADRWLAIMTDEHTFSARCPVFRFTDTMWLVALTNLAWEQGLVPTG